MRLEDAEGNVVGEESISVRALSALVQTGRASRE
jgi:hypothetical protein